MAMARHSLLLAALALAACSQKAEDEAPADKTVADRAVAEPGAAASASAPAPGAPEAVPTAIPQAIRGRWGLVAADCTSTRGDAKGLLTIDATSLKFYESVAKLGAIKDGDAGEIEATYAFTGEGQSWTLDVDLELEDGGKTLIRKDTGPDALPGPLTYTRCA